MKRRTFIAGLGGAAVWPLVAPGQQKLVRIGLLNAGGDATRYPGWPIFVEAFRDLGWIEGKNFIYENRFADNKLDRLPDLAAELVGLHVDLIFTVGTLAPLAAKRATTTIPIVLTSAGDPIGSGLVTNLARPGGNITGFSLMAPELGGKRLELLKELVPQISRIAVFWNSANPYSANSLKETESAARSLGIDVQSLGLEAPGDLNAAFDAIGLQNPDAVIAIEDPLTMDQRRKIIDFVTARRLPTIYGIREFVQDGGLMAYGSLITDLLRRSADYIDKILKGAKPGDLPIEQPTKFELIINLRAAKQIDLEIPVTILARADEVIE
jgi:putative tryptophan/tyrosine transport system substrate-binding protein